VTNNTELSAPSPKVFRLIDANLNRLREGIRVSEDIVRFLHDDKTVAYTLKNLRHKAKVQNYKEYLSHRDIIGDVLKNSTKSEQSRSDIEAVLIANIKRAQESARVLEECFKIFSINESENFKAIRYELYDIEKQLLT
jgi:thiamine-phosphate pyrophosphorylase